MSEAELRELDLWIADKFMGWKPLDSEPPSWDDGTHIITHETTSFSDAFQPTRLPSAFALVKREIERRGWRWVCAYDRLSKVYGFEITIEEDTIGIVAESEELAGCLAVKAAIEGAS